MSAGVLHILCAAHNRVRQEKDTGRAIASVLNLPPISGRAREGQLRALAKSLSEALSYPGVSTEPMALEVRRKMCQQLSLQIVRQWKRARSLPATSLVQPLGCFGASDLTLDGEGLLEGPGRRFGCRPEMRCAAAGYLSDKPEALEKIVAFLRPGKEGDPVRDKPEMVRARAALKELINTGPVKFNKRYCRALGDSYFAVMCPPGSHVITTNTVDHQPLCAVLGKQAINPLAP